MKTRTKQNGKATSKPSDDSQNASGASKSLPANVATPPNIFVLPKDVSEHARIITVPDGTRSSRRSRVLLCPSRGFFEFTQVSSTDATRSWLLTPTEDQEDAARKDGYVLRQPLLLVATPLDPLFIAAQLIIRNRDYAESYLASSDYIFSEDAEGFEQWQHVLRQVEFADVLKRLEDAVASVCTSISMGEDEQLYRFSIDKLCQVMLSRAIIVASNKLPQSMEQQFVVEASQVPETQIETSEIEEAEKAIGTESSISTTSQDSTTLSPDTSISTSTAATSFVAEEQPDKFDGGVKHLLRVRTVWEYMLRSYVPHQLHEALRKLLTAQTTLDFTPLEEHESKISAAKQQIQALRTLSDNISRKHPVDDDEAAEKAIEKRRKIEEEEQRKKNVSHGVKKLMKADTSGMKKLSSFFTKAPKK